MGFGLSLIVAIGAQNAFVLRQGLRREHVLPVVSVCAVSDAVLIVVGVAGLGELLELVPWMIDALRVMGAAFLFGYALIAARRALSPSALAASAGGESTPLWTVLGTCVALTWLNPHVYLDTVVLLGSVAASRGDDRWAFGAGAVLGSVVWFAALGYGARFLRPVFARPAAWRVLDAVIALVMTGIAVSLLLGISG
jgi:L-lysine exporter family protein LysE/ArgO